MKIMMSMLVLCISLVSYAQISLPAASPLMEMNQRVGLSTISLRYSRPSLRGRSLFGEEGILIPGEKWRTGANATTQFEISEDLEIQGKKLKKGTYALLTTPGTKEWTFHFYPYEKRSWTHFLDQEPILTCAVVATQTPHSTETLLLYLDEIELDEAKLVLAWEHYRIELPIKLNEHEQIMANIEKELSGPSNFAYFQAALYLHETQTDLPLALTYIQKATASEKALFFQVYREALILRDLGRNEEAVMAAKRAVELSEKAGNAELARLSQRMIHELSEGE